MIFARFKKYNEKLEGKFVDGRTYLGHPGGGGGAVDLNTISFIDENGETIREHPSDGRFEYQDEIFAVVVKPFSDYAIGEVVVITDARQNGGLFFNVEDEGFFRGELMAILDRTNVSPGTSVLDISIGKWLPISSVDECLWIKIFGGKLYRSPSEFRFSVSSDGDILESPVKVCINPTGLNLTHGNVYQIIGESEDQLVVKDDGGIEIKCSSDRFGIL